MGNVAMDSAVAEKVLIGSEVYIGFTGLPVDYLLFLEADLAVDGESLKGSLDATRVDRTKV